MPVGLNFSVSKPPKSPTQRFPSASMSASRPPPANCPGPFPSPEKEPTKLPRLREHVDLRVLRVDDVDAVERLVHHHAAVVAAELVSAPKVDR